MVFMGLKPIRPNNKNAIIKKFSSFFIIPPI